VEECKRGWRRVALERQFEMEVGGYIYIRSWVRGWHLGALDHQQGPLCEAMRREETSSRVKNGAARVTAAINYIILAGYCMRLQDMDMTRQGTVWRRKKVESMIMEDIAVVLGSSRRALDLLWRDARGSRGGVRI